MNLNIVQGALTILLPAGIINMIVSPAEGVYGMQKIRRVRPLTIVIAFFLLIVLFFGMVFAALHHGEKVHFGYVSGVHAFGAAHLLQSASPQYTCSPFSNEDALVRALDNQLTDAALISIEKALTLPEDRYMIHGVFSVTELTAVTHDATVTGMGSLSGRTLILPSDLENTKTAAMLQALLTETDAAGYTLRYVRDPAAAYAATPGSVMLLPLEELEKVLGKDPTLTARFRLSSQWRTSFLSAAPAGHVIVCRRDAMGTGTFNTFEKAVRSSVLYADRKRKKTVAMAAGAGLFDNEAAADRVFDLMSFSYLEDADRDASIDAWKGL